MLDFIFKFFAVPVLVVGLIGGIGGVLAVHEWPPIFGLLIVALFIGGVIYEGMHPSPPAPRGKEVVRATPPSKTVDPEGNVTYHYYDEHGNETDRVLYTPPTSEDHQHFEYRRVILEEGRSV